MALELSFDVSKLYKTFWEDLATKFPKGFASIPTIAALENAGYKLKSVQNIGEEKYKPNEFRKFVSRYLLPYGHTDDAEAESVKQAEVFFYFKKEGKEFILETDIILSERILKLGVDDPEKHLREIQS